MTEDTGKDVTPSDVLQDAPTASDAGNCKRFVSDWKHQVRYVPPWKTYVVYDGTRWSIDENKKVVELAKGTVTGIYREALYAETEDERKALAKHALRSEAAPRIDAMIRLAESVPGIPLGADAFDADPWLLNVANGTLDLRTGALRAHRSTDLIMKILPVAYDAAAPCPRWLAFLNEIMAGKADLVSFLQKSIGYSLTGDIREQVFFILWGAGANGKTVFLKVIESMLGDYARQASMDTFMQKEYAGIPNDIARLHGVRFVAASEAEQNRRLAEALVKSLTGGDKIVARFLHKEFFEFTPRFKIFLATNHKPVIRGSEHAIWRRIRLVPFTVTIPPERQDKELAAKLIEELPGILAWAVQGCRVWLADGLEPPASVKEATEEYRGEMDTVGAFLSDRCEIASTFTATAASLFAAYQKWAKESGEREMTQTSFGRALRERGFESDKTGARGRFWVGLAVTDNGSAPPSREPGDESGGDLLTGPAGF